jgi:hypothetical protein
VNGKAPKASKTVKTKNFFSFFLYKEARAKKNFFSKSTTGDGPLTETMYLRENLQWRLKNGGAGDPFDETAGAVF